MTPAAPDFCAFRTCNYEEFVQHTLTQPLRRGRFLFPDSGQARLLTFLLNINFPLKNKSLLPSS